MRVHEASTADSEPEKTLSVAASLSDSTVFRATGRWVSVSAGDEPVSVERLAGALWGEDAATLSGAADATSTIRHEPGIARYLEQRWFSPARARLGETTWHAAYAAGAALDRDQAIEAALQAVGLRIAA